MSIVSAAWYLAGLFSIPAVAILVNMGVWAFGKHHSIECTHCGKVLGTRRRNWRITTELRWKAHYLRYWYRSRPNWTCRRPAALAAKAAEGKGPPSSDSWRGRERSPKFRSQ